MTELLDPADLDRVEEIENIWIPLPDGTRLAARLWLPEGSRRSPVPALLEYLPYRKRDFMRARDETMHRYYAFAGYASLRVDIRGTGDSEGIIHDEYSPTEHEDALHVLAWIASQEWCSGEIGMTGISWGGFNSLQVAALRPAELKAVISLCAADDRYADDAHYKGGCLLNENMQWGSFLTMNNALPPDPEIAGDNWREAWKQRLAALEAFPALWMEHPWRDEYWTHGSVCEDYTAIQCPVYVIGGWADGYTNAVMRLLKGLNVPRKGLIGPWGHAFPHNAVPGPRIGYLQEAVRWWDYWLKGIDTGIMDEPMLRVWMQEAVPPQPQYELRPGRWVAESAWPSERLVARRWHLARGTLSDQQDDSGEIPFSSPHTLGVRAGEWCGFGSAGEAPRDQRADDGGSLTFDSEALEADIDILGTPALSVEIKSNRPVAFLIARLCDVHPDGSSARISYGILNLCHHKSHASPEPLHPGEWYPVTMHLDDLGQRVPAGHRLRLALSTGYWPMIWPTPEPVTLTLRIGSGTLDLPVRPATPGDLELADFPPPLAAPGSEHTKLRRAGTRRTVEVDLISNEMVYTLRSDGDDFGGASLARIEDIDLEVGQNIMKRYRIVEDDPLSAQTELRQSVMLRRKDWSIRVDCHTRLTATANGFQFTGDLEAFENDAPFDARRWTLTIPRRLL